MLQHLQNHLKNKKGKKEEMKDLQRNWKEKKTNQTNTKKPNQKKPHIIKGSQSTSYNVK